MRRSYVAIDLETTGLDPDREAIMEIGAVRFDLDGNSETFSTFVDPQRPIPYRIQRLTHISDADVAGAPQFANVAADLEAFIGDDPVVGQNVQFDLNFLARSLVEPPGPAYDTQELAGVLLPGLAEQNLSSIARYLDIDFPVQHRALADAEAARLVFLALRKRLAALPRTLLAEAERVAAPLEWSLAHLLRELLEERPPSSDDAKDDLPHGALRRIDKPGQALSAVAAESSPVDAELVERALTTGARDVIDEFEDRPQQVEMARAVTAALNEGRQLLVEAGTGVGKSLAYLLPAARYALQNETRVVISTNTINLQGQLVGKDIPDVRSLLGGGEMRAAKATDGELRAAQTTDGELRAAQLKGRRNYLCLLRWSALRHAATRSEDEAKLLVRLLLWLPHTDTGDLAELRLSPGETTVWNRLSAQQEACLATPSAFVKDGSCFLLRARKRAEAAHVLVVNHALVLSDVAVGGGVIPDYAHLIVDEAQHLEAEATRQFGFQAGEEDIGGFLDSVASRGGGLVNALRNASRGLGGQVASNQELLEAASGAQDDADRARERIPEFFTALAGFLRQQFRGTGGYESRLSLTRAMRVQPDWGEIELAWENLSAALGQVVVAVERLHTGLQAGEAANLLDYETMLTEAADLAKTGAALREGIDNIVLRDDANTVCWLTQQRSAPGVALASAPLLVSELLQERLFSQKETTVLTSATLTTNGSFDYMRETLGLDEVQELQLGSPFDYAASTLVLAPTDMPDPNDSDYMAALQESMIELIRASRGRALALFTSHASLRAAHAGIRQALQEEEILVLGHNIDGSPRQLTRALRENPNTVVLGTASFWEGVDIVGEALSLLIVARLPFAVPDDPVFKARSELHDNPFTDYAVPNAALRFKQGFGRLIRRKSDRGVLAVLDGRITSKSYGKAFLRSLPPCRVEQVPVATMPGLVAHWLDKSSP